MPSTAFTSAAALSLGRRVRTLRHACGHTLESLGEAVGVTAQFVWRIEDGASMPSLAVAVRLAAALGVSLDELVLGVATT